MFFLSKEDWKFHCLFLLLTNKVVIPSNNQKCILPQKHFVWAFTNSHNTNQPSFISLQIVRHKESNVYIRSIVNWLLSWHWHPCYDAAVVKVAALIVCQLHHPTAACCMVLYSAPHLTRYTTNKQVLTYTSAPVWWTLHWTGGFYFFTCFAANWHLKNADWQI